MSDESDKEVIWALDKGAKELTTEERLRQVEEEAEENYGKREVAEKEDLGRERMKHEERDSRAKWQIGKGRAKVEGQDTNARRNFVIPHFLKTEKKIIKHKSAIRQNSVEYNNQIVGSNGKFRLRTEGEFQRTKRFFREKAPRISSDNVKRYLGIVEKYAEETNHQGNVDESSLNEIDRLLRTGNVGTKRQTKEFMDAVRKGEVSGVKIEKDTDMRNIFSRSTAQKLRNILNLGDNSRSTPEKPELTRPERNESPRFSNGNRGPGPSSSVRP